MRSLFITLCSLTALACVDPVPPAPVDDRAEALEHAINAYRAEHGLPPIASSPSLRLVADTHVWDLEYNLPIEPCSLHSWSDAGPWRSCCYVNESPDLDCMLDKARELSLYDANGYEIAVSYFGPKPLTPTQALSLWMASPSHNDVILNRGPWADAPWLAMWAAITEHYAVVWFGKEVDPH